MPYTYASVGMQKNVWYTYRPRLLRTIMRLPRLRTRSYRERDRVTQEPGALSFTAPSPYLPCVSSVDGNVLYLLYELS